MAWSPMDIVGGVVWIPTSHLDAMWEQNGFSVVATTPGVGDPVGTIDSSLLGFSVSCNADASRPIRGSKSLVFSGSQYLDVRNSTGLRFFFYSKVFSISLRVKFSNASNGTGANETISDQIASTGANIGINISRDTANKISFQIGGNGSNIVVFATNLTINDTNEHHLFFRADGTKMTARLDGGAVATSANFAAGTGITAATYATADIRLGLLQGGTRSMRGEIRDFFVASAAISSEDEDSLRNYDPAETSESLARTLADDDELEAYQLSHLSHLLDATDPAQLYFKSDRSTGIIAADGDPVGYVESAYPAVSGSDLIRYFSQATDARRPTWRSSGFNGGSLPYLEYDSRPADFDGGDFTGEIDLVIAGGGFSNGTASYVMLFENDDDTQAGSHILAAANINEYVVVTSQNYIGSTPGCFLGHGATVTGSSLAVCCDVADGSDSPMIGILRFGPDGFWVAANNKFSNTSLGGTSLRTDPTHLRALHIGRPAHNGQAWGLKGKLVFLARFNTRHPAIDLAKVGRKVARRAGMLGNPVPLAGSVMARKLAAYTQAA